MKRCLPAIAWLAAVLAASAAAHADEDPWFRGGRSAVMRARALHPNAGRAKNVVLFVGDGMGVSTVTAARILEGQLRGESGEENRLAFEALPYLALAKTYNTNQQVPDSAGTMSAMVTGVKTKARVISLDDGVVVGDAASAAGARIPTLCEQAKERGMATGVVTTTRVTHATPIACFSHAPERGWESDAQLPLHAGDFPDLARQLLDVASGDGPEVILGGGAAMFRGPAQGGGRRDGRDLIGEWLAARPGALFVASRQALLDADVSSAPLLGLFADSHLAFEADRAATREPSLSEMTTAAIERLLRHERGFVLIVEGGRIDHAHHLTNAQRALRDAIEFSNAVQVALDRLPRAETLVVVTADHGHVFTIAGYPTRGNDILGQVVSNRPDGTPAANPSQDLEGAPYPTLGYTNGPGGGGVGAASATRRAIRADLETGSPAQAGLPSDHLDFRQPTAIPLAIETHSGEDVPIYAGGPGAALFHGVQEQHYVYHAIVEALGWNADAEGNADGARRAGTRTGAQ